MSSSQLVHQHTHRQKNLELVILRIPRTTYAVWTYASLHLQNASHPVRLHLASILNLPQLELDSLVKKHNPPKAQSHDNLTSFGIWLPPALNLALSHASLTLKQLNNRSPKSHFASKNQIFNAVLLDAAASIHLKYRSENTPQTWTLQSKCTAATLGAGSAAP